MQKVILITKDKLPAILVAVLSALFSTWNITDLQAFWRPPLVFVVAFLCIWRIRSFRDFHRVLILLFLFPPIYYLVLFLGGLSTISFGIGASLVFLLIHSLLRHENSLPLQRSIALMFLVGFLLDGLMIASITSKVDLSFVLSEKVGDYLAFWPRLNIGIWQMLTLYLIDWQFRMEPKKEELEIWETKRDGF